MHTLKPFAFLAILISLCVLPKLTAEEKLELPGTKPTPINNSSLFAYPWESGDEAAIRARLAKRCAEFSFDGITCEQAFTLFRDLTGSNLVVHWSALEAAAIEKDREITVHLTEVKYGQVLELVLDNLGGNEVDLGYEIRGNVIQISTREDLARSTIVITYDVRDLMGYTSVHTLWGETTYTCGDLGRLVDVIQESVDPESWREAGGNTGTIRDYGEMLIITQTRSAHLQIWDLLNSMRKGWKQERF